MEKKEWVKCGTGKAEQGELPSRFFRLRDDDSAPRAALKMYGFQDPLSGNASFFSTQDKKRFDCGVQK